MNVYLLVNNIIQQKNRKGKRKTEKINFVWEKHIKSGGAGDAFFKKENEK